MIRTGSGKNDGLLARVSMGLAAPFMRSPASGACPLVWFALDPAGGELRGAHVERDRPVEPSAPAGDDALAAALWEQSEALTAPWSG